MVTNKRPAEGTGETPGAILGIDARPGSAAAIRAFRRGAAALRYGSGVVLAYHDIVPGGEHIIDYAVSERTFRAQLDIVRSLGYRFCSLREMSERLLGGRSVRKMASVVFDDALVGVYDSAMPELARRGIPWTLLPVTERLGVEPEWWPGARRTMSAKEIEEAVSAGADLCAHTSTHVSLPDVEPSVARRELESSRARLSEWAGHEVVDLCYPFGHQNAEVRAMAVDAGFRTGWTFTNGRCSPLDDPFRLPRMAMRNDIGTIRWGATVLRPRASWPRVLDLSAGVR